MAIDLSHRSRPQLCTAVIESKEQLTEKVYLVNFRMQNPPELAFLPGQTFSLHVGEGLNRSMSIASASSDTTHVLMCHDVGPMGPGSKWTLAHNVGDTATFMAPLGIFILDKQSPRKKVLVATGTGIAPFRSMLLDVFSGDSAEVANKNLDSTSVSSSSTPSSQPLRESEAEQNFVRSPQSKRTEISLYWGLRHEEDIYWKEEFEGLVSKHDNVRFRLTLSKPKESWTGLRGRVTDHVVQEEASITESEFYLCGNKEMVKDMEEQLAQKGVPKQQIYRELYF